MSKLLKRSFFERDTLKVAPELLGKSIVIKSSSKKEKKGIIVEVEAYTADDPACHASKGETQRTKVMFGPGGYSYVYLIYGMYHCLNFVSKKKSIPGAVLIRALEIPNEDIKAANGPGKLCRFFNLTKKHNNIDCTNSDSPIYLLDEGVYKTFDTVQTSRIGISNAKDYPWRWYIKGNKYVSRS